MSGPKIMKRGCLILGLGGVVVRNFDVQVIPKAMTKLNFLFFLSFYFSYVSPKLCKVERF
ncbi:unnamed protein product [Brassica rapa subsp. narinosa]